MKVYSGFRTGDHFIVEELDKLSKSRGEPQVCQVRIKKWDDFSQLKSILRNDVWVYRGQESAEWPLKSGIERENNQMQSASSRSNALDRIEVLFREMSTSLKPVGANLPDEKTAVQNFKCLVKGLSSLHCGESLIEHLAAMQHYGTKTRLLDFTYSIYVALFFAFERRCTNYPRSIWCVRLERLIENLQKDISTKQIKNGKGLHHDSNQRGVSNRDVLNRFAAMRDEILKLADTNIKNSSAKCLGIIPVHILGNNARMDAQNGLFLMPCNFRPFVENLARAFGIKGNQIECPKIISYNEWDNAIKDAVIVKIVFDTEMEKDAWKILDETNITPRTIYPDLEGIAKSIRYNAG